MRPSDAYERLRRNRAGPRLVTPLFLLVMGATLAYFVSVGALIPTLPRFVEGPLGGGDLAVGIVVGAFALSAVIVRPMTGALGDRSGRSVLITGGAGLVAATVASYTLASSLPALVTLRVLSGLGEAAFYVGAASVINDLAPDERRGEALSYFSLALYGGLAIGPVVGEAVLDMGGYDLTWMVAAAAATVAALLGLRVPDTRSVGPEGRMRGRVVHPAALLPGAILACSVWGLAGYNTFVPLYALSLGLTGSRGVLALYSVIVIAVRSLGARIPDRLGPPLTARAALGVSAVGLLIVAVWSEPAGLYTGTALFALGQSLTFPALMTIAIHSAPAAERSSVIGTFTAFFDLAFGAGAVSLGAVAEAIGYGGSFFVAAAVTAAGAGLLLARAQRARNADPSAVSRAA